jgi:hypothetical protein
MAAEPATFGGQNRDLRKSSQVGAKEATGRMQFEPADCEDYAGT